MRTTLFVTAIFLAIPSLVHASELDALMAAFQKVPGVEARFEDVKHIALLAAPLKSQGVLRYAAPNKLSRVTESPQPSRLLILEDRLFVDDGKKTSEIPLSANETVRAFVNSFVLFLAGDRKGLDATFDMKMIGAATNAWTVELTPKRPPISKIITKLTIAGVGVELSTLTVAEASGDRTETRFFAVDAKRRFASDEQAQHFAASR